jgi:hypothetical protein
LLVDANGRDGDGLSQRRSPLFEWNDFPAALVKCLNDAAVMAQIFAKVLHLLQELFTFVQREFTLAVGAVQQLVLSVVVGKKKGKMKKKRLRRPFHQGASFLFSLSLLVPDNRQHPVDGK